MPRRALLLCRVARIEFISFFAAPRNAGQRNGAMRHNYCEPSLTRERSRISGFCYALAFLWGAGVLLRCLTKKNEDKGPILDQSKYRSVYLQLLQTRFRDAIFHKLVCSICNSCIRPTFHFSQNV